MTKLIRTLSLLSAALLLTPALPRAEDAWTDEPAQAAEPQPQPGEMPPAPPAETPPPPQAMEAPAQAPAAVPPGQWVYTQQYGWIWMPYADSYTSVPASDSGAPFAYVYYPASSCWTWVAAPWVWGWGPWPFFGVTGAVRFGWYGHGWWRYPSRWHYAAPVRGFAGGYGGSGFVPSGRGGWVAAPSRGGTVGGYRAPAAVPRAPSGGYRAPAFAPRTGVAPFRASAGPFSGGRASGFSPGRVGGFSPGRVAAGGGRSAPSGGGRSGGFGVGRGGGGSHGRRG
jgi:hypothetical protein